MSDKELLEKAAKAAGIDLEHAYYIPTSGAVMTSAGYGMKPWNPLTEDGDALRLAAKLYLWEAVRFAHRLVDDKTDIYAATRRAIVRAAAAMADQKEREQ